jgi:hypothetical protein
MSSSHELVQDVSLSKQVPWNLGEHVLGTQGFPLSTTLRGKFRKVLKEKDINPEGRTGLQKCSCIGEQRHRDVFAFNATMGRDFFLGKLDKLPNIHVCWNSYNLFEEKIPRYLVTGKRRPAKGYKSSTPRVLFENLRTVQEAVTVLYNGTYWCHGITHRPKAGKKQESDPVTTLRLYQLLAQNFVSKTPRLLGEEPLSKVGVNHLKQILGTVDGLCIQLCLAFPDIPEIQNWEYFDRIMRSMIKHLLEDWTSKNGARESFYEKLKSIRKSIKQLAFHEYKTVDELVIPREFSFLRLPISLLKEKTTRNMFRVGLLIQTRACGTPPPNVFMKTYRKFRETVTLPAEPPGTEATARLAWATKLVYQELVMDNKVGRPAFMDAFRKALTRAKISLSDSAELNNSRESGGKYEAFRKIAHGLKDVREIDLTNGDQLATIPDIPENLGTRAFHHSLWAMLNEEITDLMTVRSAGVLEPGKVREITVSDIHHAVLLHPISHVVLDIIARVPSSESGVHAANHAFEFYRRLNHKNPRGGFIFDKRFSDDLWIMSSDLETATDYTNPYITEVILETFLGPECLGIPELYREVTKVLLTGPRTVVDPRTNEEFITSRGCFMGDPMTKAVLHLHHLVSKQITDSLFHGRE